LYLLLKRILWKLGYTLHNKEISALPTRGNDPREVAYLDELPYTVQNFPLVTGTGLRYYGFTGRTYHPFVLALSQQTYGLSRQQFVYRLLKKYNELFSLTNANDFIGLAKEEEFFSSGSDPYHFTYPWSSLDPDEHQELISRTVLEENKKYGLNSSCSLELTNASDYKISIETRRLKIGRAHV